MRFRQRRVRGGAQIIAAGGNESSRDAVPGKGAFQ
jgi:hypothetical protein